MRTPSFAVLVALGLLTFTTRDVRADSFFHLPCDPDASLSVGGGIFKGHTQAPEIGRVEFERILLGAPRLELTLFENCRGSATQLKMTRRWFGRVNVFGAIVPERTRLSLDNELAGPGNTLLRADLSDALSTSYSIGARASILDTAHFHIEAYLERTGTIGWNEADAGTVVARVNNASLDVTDWVRDYAEVVYKFRIQSYGVTIGVPLKRNTVTKWRVVPFLTLGRMRLTADVEARIVDAKFAATLENLGVDLTSVTKRRSLDKSWWSANGGARLDIRNSLSAELSVAYGQTQSTTIYVVMLSVSRRFNLPSLKELGGTTIPMGGLPF